MSNIDLDEVTDSSTFLLSRPDSPNQHNSRSDRINSSPPSSRRLHLSSKRIALILFFAIYTLIVLVLRSYSARDPTSVFFNESLGYEGRYSSIRTVQSESFIEGINNGSTNATHPSQGTVPQLCVVVPTVARSGKQYVRDTIGSLLEGLAEAERQQLYLILFIAHTDPNVHPIYNETWTRRLPDQVLSYGAAGNLDVPLSEIQRWENASAYIPKGLFDYAMALDACSATAAPLVGVIEGDVLAARGWARRALHAGAALPSLSLGASASSLYLRLFYTETYLGWNSEFWGTYLGASFGLWLVTLALLLGLRRSRYRSVSSALSLDVVVFVTCLALPLSILLFFLAGRMTVWPLPRGIVRMDNFGCCSQAHVFPRVHVPMLVEQLRSNWAAATRELLDGHPTPHIPYVDMLMEFVANSKNLARWATVPALFQHVGIHSSKGDPVADARARKIWNFGFEDLDAETGVGEMGRRWGWG